MQLVTGIVVSWPQLLIWVWHNQNGQFFLRTSPFRLAYELDLNAVVAASLKSYITWNSKDRKKLWSGHWNLFCPETSVKQLLFDNVWTKRPAHLSHLRNHILFVSVFFYSSRQKLNLARFYDYGEFRATLGVVFHENTIKAEFTKFSFIISYIPCWSSQTYKLSLKIGTSTRQLIFNENRQNFLFYLNSEIKVLLHICFKTSRD